VFVAKAVLLLCIARKTRDADHAVCLFYDLDRLAPDKVAKAFAEEAARTVCDLPDDTFDCHTQKGRKAGRTEAEFFPTEFDALKPRDPGAVRRRHPGRLRERHIRRLHRRRPGGVGHLRTPSFSPSRRQAGPPRPPARLGAHRDRGNPGPR
jgi:hypothetical protein